MYQVGDKILYANTGACVIERIESLRFDRKREKYYVLCPLFQKTSVIYVPVENQELTSKMQPMPSRDEAEHLIDSLPAMEVFSIPDAQERKAYIDELMHQKGNGGLLKVIKSLYGIKRQRIREGKSLHVSDENALHEALRLLCDELAYPLGTEPSQIFDRLQTTLEENA